MREKLEPVICQIKISDSHTAAAPPSLRELLLAAGMILMAMVPLKHNSMSPS